MKTHTDLAVLASDLKARLSQQELAGYLRGKTRVRDAIRDRLECSDLVAEQLVEELIGFGMLNFHGDPTTPSASRDRWTLDPQKATTLGSNAGDSP
ncbi:MAG: hypothetical protein KC776_16780 [Myxococcales bacterium]|nr:hypothetical protein [Myxococcales bacterium]MCB9575534.1 hypothetical protein [Polyangiaceae bacterium]